MPSAFLGCSSSEGRRRSSAEHQAQPLCTHTLRSQGFAVSFSLISPLCVRAAVCGCSLGSQSDSAHLCSLPAGFRLNASSWPMFLLKTLNGAEMAPIRIFHKVLGCLGAHPPPAWGTSTLPALPCAAPPGSSVPPLLAQGRAQCLHSTMWAVPSSLGMQARQLTGLTPPHLLHLLMEVSGDGGAALLQVGTAAL